jgi:uncharacterized protein YlxW (UPF0749 family)
MAIASVGSVLAPLAALACPIGMGAMMWLMARAGKKREAPRPERADRHVSLETVREEQRRLNDQIDRLESSASNGEQRSVRRS